MMLDFLKNYIQAINLDDKQYDCNFPKGVSRSDFLLFNKQVVCEVKEIETIQVQSQIEKLSQRVDLSEQDFKRSLYNSIERALSKANKQIQATKEALNLPTAFGLIILENKIPRHLSIISLVDAAERKMYRGLVNTDCIVCLDFVNTLSALEGENKQVTGGQVVSRGTEESKKLFILSTQLIKDFCNQTGTPLLEGWKIEEASQMWFVDETGKYERYSVKMNLKLLTSEKKSTWRQRALHFLNRWGWAIPLPFIYYDWFIR